jgi:hypothetical protein
VGFQWDYSGPGKPQNAHDLGIKSCGRLRQVLRVIFPVSMTIETRRKLKLLFAIRGNAW